MVAIKLTPYQGPKRTAGKFRCSCGNTWTSGYTWSNHFQKCERCDKKTYPYTQSPNFSTANKASKMRRDDRPIKYHKRELCGKCITDRKPCDSLPRLIRSRSPLLITFRSSSPLTSRSRTLIRPRSSTFTKSRTSVTRIRSRSPAIRPSSEPILIDLTQDNDDEDDKRSIARLIEEENSRYLARHLSRLELNNPIGDQAELPKEREVHCSHCRESVERAFL